MVTLPFLVLLICKGGRFLFAILIGIVSLLALWEYCRIVFPTQSGPTPSGPANHAREGKSFSTFNIQLLAFIMGPMIIWAAYRNSCEIISGLISLNLIIAASLSLPRFNFDSLVPEIVIKQALSIIYIPLFLSYLILLRNDSAGSIWILFLLSIVFAGDIGAFYVGSYWGRHKLCPAVSPAKTIEGSIGGLVAILGVGSLFKYFFLPVMPWGKSVLFFIFLGIAGQIGDLFESELKRAAHMDDSGRILPGHGGILDRIDALLFAAPVAFFFKEYIL